jgi:hypothetical protein
MTLPSVSQSRIRIGPLLLLDRDEELPLDNDEKPPVDPDEGLLLGDDDGLDEGLPDEPD